MSLYRRQGRSDVCISVSQGVPCPLPSVFEHDVLQGPGSYAWDPRLINPWSICRRLFVGTWSPRCAVQLLRSIVAVIAQSKQRRFDPPRYHFKPHHRSGAGTVAWIFRRDTFFPLLSSFFLASARACLPACLPKRETQKKRNTQLRYLPVISTLACWLPRPPFFKPPHAKRLPELTS